MLPTFHSGEDTLCSGSKKRCFVGWVRAARLSGDLRSHFAPTLSEGRGHLRATS
ncbi:MAG: hypothetical protein V7K32_18095 [Nostoc sp.]|uniref:hypothetical protein n=1 Tax=Nostoc sp. TaxID=1180 RepID=UPI002FFA757E